MLLRKQRRHLEFLVLWSWSHVSLSWFFVVDPESRALCSKCYLPWVVISHFSPPWDGPSSTSQLTSHRSIHLPSSCQDNCHETRWLVSPKPAYTFSWHSERSNLPIYDGVHDGEMSTPWYTIASNPNAGMVCDMGVYLESPCRSHLFRRPRILCGLVEFRILGSIRTRLEPSSP